VKLHLNLFRHEQNPAFVVYKKNSSAFCGTICIDYQRIAFWNYQIFVHVKKTSNAKAHVPPVPVFFIA
jgi:hypothetical protein